ncbi:hypothetical protein CANARDRAFT_26159 [[Candida] arabinofermentans NRRL YB-2248]|uniref:Protein BFR2 n=1 Tax=[Candida] arabinofermentans NRRL YB-2248 TaxID=983967 RepID=A0A1E4T8C5_9ASCO|nr:hypothetical protein CANARDRAFT_26159 [[Candida] arabinofermentans NRRL YB-2248]
MARKSRSIAEEIAREIATPKTKDYDIEDEEGAFKSEDDSNSSDSDNEDLKSQHYVKSSKSKLRSTTINLGSKYTGEKTSRAELFDDEAEVSGEDSNDDDDQESEDASEEDFNNESDESNDILADVTDSEAEEQESGSEEDDSDSESDSPETNEEDDYKRSRLNQLLAQEKKQIISRLSTSAKTDALKGYSVLQQYKFFDKVLDSRIKIQKAITGSNQLPVSPESFKKLATKSTNAKLEEAQELIAGLLEKTLLVRAKVYNKEKITKDTVSVNIKKRSLAALSSETEKLDEILNVYRKSVLVKWSNKVQAASGSTALNSGKFKTINQNTYTQVENTLQDMGRLIKRTKLNRRNVTPLGYVEPEQKLTGSDDDDLDSEDEEERKQQSNMDRSLQEKEFIFDDDDFYRVLLNDMVDKKISDKQATSASAIITLTTNKIHKNYDRKATKGRKLKYTVQEQLQNFEAPKQKYYLWNDDQIDELFASLLGQKVNMNEESGSESDEDTEDKEAVVKSGLKLFG